MRDRNRVWHLPLLLIFGVAVGSGSEAGRATPKVATIDAEQAAARLVDRMTPDEKFSQLINGAPAITRLHVPAYEWWSEGLHGLQSENMSTNFPEPIGLAASFDRAMVERVAAAIGTEIRDNHKLEAALPPGGQASVGLNVWAPNINIFRDPRWGRGQETYGEDPFLTASLGVAFVRGMQGPDPSHPLVIATPKHFAVHSGPEATRHSADVSVSAHDLEDTYLPAFRAAVVEGKAGSVMCAYNAVNGAPACANDFLLKTRLRGSWGFRGFVVSDCGALSDIYQQHKYRGSEEEAVAVAIRSGTDLECGLDRSPALFGKAVASGYLTMADIDRSLRRLFTARFRTGDLPRDGPPVTGHVGPSIGSTYSVARPSHRIIAREAARESIVLLKNDGLLPFPAGVKRIAVIGPLADSLRVMRGNYSSGRQAVNMSVLDGLRSIFPKAVIRHALAGPFAGDGDVVPNSALLTPDGRPGLRLEYFAEGPSPPADAQTARQARVTIAPDARSLGTSIVPTLDVLPYFVDGVRGLPDRFDMIWTGFLVAPETGLYRIGIKGEGNLEIDGKPVVPGKDAVVPLSTMRLRKGEKYTLKVTARKRPFFTAQLIWKRVAEDAGAELEAAVKDADVVVAVVGLTSDLEGEEAKVDLPGFRSGDRTNIDISPDQADLLKQAKASGRPLVVVALSGSATNLRWAKDNANAVVQAWYPGQEGGLAIADVLSGAYNPAGRLPVSFYEDLSGVPAFDDYSMARRTYRYSTKPVLFPFGYGLSYTSFAYRDPRVTNVGGEIRVEADLLNQGKTAGDEVAQLYLNFPDKEGAPRIALRGFDRVHLRPGETRHVVFKLSPRDLSMVDMSGCRIVAAGRYTAFVGGGQPGHGVATVSASFTLNREVPLAP